MDAKELTPEQANTVQCADAWPRTQGLPTYTDLRAALPSDAAQAQASLDAVCDVFGIGSRARSLSTLLVNCQNARRRSDCLSGIEQLFTYEVPDEDDVWETAEECDLNWGHDRAQYVEAFKTALPAFVARNPEYAAPVAPQAAGDAAQAPHVELPERIIDNLFQAAGVSTCGPDGEDILDKLHAFARNVVAETLARLPAAPVPPAAVAQMPKARRDGAYPEYREPDELLSAAQPDERAALKRAMDLLDAKLGDTDPNIEGMTQDEVEDTYPVLSAMQILSGLYSAPQATVKGDAPFSNCSFRHCDLPGQCKAEGACHHPARAAAPQASTLTDEQIRRVFLKHFDGRTWESINIPDIILFVRALLAAHPTEKASAGAMSAAARDVLAERGRQVEVEQYEPDSDDAYEKSELAYAAAAYAITPATIPPFDMWCALWPWDMAHWKPTTQRRNLVKAGALILAEIERLDRAARTGGK